MTITDEMVERFKQAWQDADARGEVGNRVRAGLKAAMCTETHRAGYICPKCGFTKPRQMWMR